MPRYRVEGVRLLGMFEAASQADAERRAKELFRGTWITRVEAVEPVSDPTAPAIEPYAGSQEAPCDS